MADELEDETTGLSEEKQREIVDEAAEFLKDAHTAESEFREDFVRDMNFVYAEDGQWEQAVKDARKGRPCYTFNRTEGAIDQIIGDQRQSRPAIKVRAAEGGDKKTAETMSGLVRNIESISNFESTQDQQFTYTVGGGYGAWRVVHDYIDDESFDQDLFIEEIPNPLSLYTDPHATDICKRDGRKALITDMMSVEQFKEEYPDTPVVSFVPDEPNSATRWMTDDEIRVAEYYRKVPKDRELLQLSNGIVQFADQMDQIIDELALQDVTIKRRRTVPGHVIEWYKLYGGGVLEGPRQYNWKYIPVVPVYGKRVNIEGEYKIKGIVRNAKDPQRSYNYIRSVSTERALMAPKFHYILTPKMIEGYDEWWKNAHSLSSPYIMANIDEDATATGGLPIPAQPSPIPPELVTVAQMDAEDIKAATGHFDASLGQQSNEVSGKAILARQREGDVGSFVYVDNLSKAIQFTGELLVDMIPRIYDTERQVRILGEDGADDFVDLNAKVRDEETGEDVIINDLSVGKYDVAVTVGPSYTTLRQESAERLIGLAGQDPELLQIGRDIIIKNMDIPGSNELEARFRKRMIAQGIIEPTDEEIEEMGPQEPDPMQELSLEAVRVELQKKVKEIEELDAKIKERLAKAGEADVDAAIKTAEFIEGDGDPEMQVSVR